MYRWNIMYVVLFLMSLPVELRADEVLLECSSTPHVVPLVDSPKSLGKTNNLRRKTALIQVADGEMIYFQGRVVDQNCVPVSDALVTIWHADSKGRYVSEDSEEEWDQYFSGSGVAYTDNLGRYSFISVRPGSVDGMAPVIHLRVEHKNFTLFETDVFLDDQLPVDITDMPYLDFSIDLLNKLTAFSRPVDWLSPNSGRVYDFSVTLPERAVFRHF